MLSYNGNTDKNTTKEKKIKTKKQKRNTKEKILKTFLKKINKS